MKKMYVSVGGFTIIEFLTAISIMSIFLIFTSPGCGSAREKAKEAETISACHRIQTALERYATDHSGKYPKQIYGGDTRGWSTKWVVDRPYGCFAVGYPHKYDPAKQPPRDPLIDLNYLGSYPKNPFMSDGSDILLRTGGMTTPGIGDPRFGFNGDVMGNCLSDPRYLWECEWQGEPSVLNEQYMFYDWEGTQRNSIAMINPDSNINPFYSMGGIPATDFYRELGAEEAERHTVLMHWPGQFFYRSSGDFFICGISLFRPHYEKIWDLPYSRINRYILGAYGSEYSEGLDLIRLTTEDGSIANNVNGYIDDYYVTLEQLWEGLPKPCWEMNLSTPEVFGGGGFGTCPTFPYWGPRNRTWLFGAPDGFRDGVIKVYIADSSSNFHRKTYKDEE